jgi:hypothetical protein
MAKNVAGSPFGILWFEPLVGLSIPGGKGRAGPSSTRHRYQTGSAIGKRLARMVRRDPQVMVKVTSRGYCAGHALAHAAYITRVQHDSLIARDEIGFELLDWGAVRQKIDGWRLSRDVVYLDPDPRRPVISDFGKLVRKIDPEKPSARPVVDDFGNVVKQKPARKLRQSVHMIFGMPAGTDPQKVLEATGSLARAEFAGHEYIMVLHEPSTDTKRKPEPPPPHPHVHVLVSALSVDRRHRLKVNKEDLFHFRQQFAKELRDLGVRATASSRLERLQPVRGESLRQRKRRERLEREFKDAAASTKHRLRRDRELPDLSLPTASQSVKSAFVLARQDYETLIHKLSRDQRREHLLVAQQLREYVDQIPMFRLSKEQLDRRAQALRDSLVPKVRGKPRDDERTR